jgi:histidine ammonia-lyase
MIGEFNLKEFQELVLSKEQIVVSEEVKSTVIRANEFLIEFSKDKIIYGINTGFGPMAQYKINEGDQVQLQYNLVRSHAQGMGSYLNEEQIRAILISRLNTLSLGKSGVDLQVVEQITLFLNHEIYPAIQEHGSVGASGDLVQLAQLGLCLIGEGKVIHNGELKATEDVLNELNIKPLELTLRDGLALINGTSCMTGIAALNTHYSRRLLEWSVLTSSMLNELMEAFGDAFSDELNGAKRHPGQFRIAKGIQSVLSTSSRIKNRETHPFLNSIPEEEKFDRKVQEYYSLRCIPQILGPVLDTLENSEKIVEQEINSVNDNPIVDVDKKSVYHGGNFHGDYISLEMDKLKIAITRVSMLMDRQFNFLLNHRLNKRFPPFLNDKVLGLNFGFQGAQYVVTSTTAENQTLGFPMYLHSIPCNNDNQDIVSMGSNSALLAARVINNTFEVLAIYIQAISKAMDLVDKDVEFSKEAQAIHNTINTLFGGVDADLPINEKGAKLSEYLKSNQPIQL